MILIKQERPGAGAQNHLPGHSDLPDTQNPSTNRRWMVIMSSSDNSNPNLPNKGTSDNCAGPYFTSNGTIEISAALDLLKEIYHNLHSLQKAVAGLHEQVQDFSAENCHDNAEVKRLLLEFRRSKVWLSREAV
jgi:hypothetical protein